MALPRRRQRRPRSDALPLSSPASSPPGGIVLTWLQIEALWNTYGGKPVNAPIAAAVALAESSGYSRARGGPNPDGSYDYGLWQINAGSGGGPWDYNLETVTRKAVAMSDGGDDWKQWCTAYTDCACGSKGGFYAPKGGRDSQHRESCSAAHYHVISAGGPVGATAPPPTRGHVPRLQLPAGVVEQADAQDKHLTHAWHTLTHTLAHTPMTQAKLARREAQRFMRAAGAKPKKHR